MAAEIIHILHADNTTKRLTQKGLISHSISYIGKVHLPYMRDMEFVRSDTLFMSQPLFVV